MEYVNRVPRANESVMDYSLLGGEHVARGRRLFQTGLVLLVATLVYLAYKADVGDPLHLFQGLLIFVLSVLPSLFWARTGGSRFPAFETTAYLLVLVIGVKVIVEGLHLPGIDFHSPAHVSFWIFWVTMLACVLYGFKRPKKAPEADAATLRKLE